MVLIHESGFIENLDEWINKKYKFHHLPYPVLCCLCGTFWLSLLFVIITGQLSLLSIALCLLNAHLTVVVQPLCRFIINALLKLVELLDRLID